MASRLSPISGGLDAYSILGIARDATDAEVKQAYHALALKHHPDKARGQLQQAATQRFQEIQAAHEAISPANRKHYDAGIAGLVLEKTSLMAACEASAVARLRRLLEDAADVHEQDATGRTALFYAASAACVEALRLLLWHGADVEHRNCAGHSCVMFAVGAGLKVDSEAKARQALRHLDAARLLLDEGAPVNAATSYGLTALMLACASGRLDMVDLLISRGADVRATTDIGLTPLAMAADKGRGSVQVVERLLAAAADPNSPYGGGKTPLMGAAAQAHEGTVAALIAGRADVNWTSDDGHSALLYAVEKGLKDGLVCPIEGATVAKPDAAAAAVAAALLGAAADPELPGPGGRRPLHAASAGGSAAMVELLLRARADARARDEAGLAPAQLAGGAGRDEVLCALAAAPRGDGSAAASPAWLGCCFARWWSLFSAGS